MTPDHFIDQALGVPFVFGRGDWNGSDCWGMVELWYRELRGIELDDRAGHGIDHKGLQSGFDAKTRWHPVDKPSDHDLVVMSARGLAAGHIGIHWKGHVLHAQNRTGCLYQSLCDRTVRTRITGYLTYQ